MPALSVNLNKVALLRNSRPIDVPSVERAARIALDAGADGLTVHPRPDGRHIRAGDIPALAVIVAEYPGREFNIEGNPFSEGDTPGARGDYPGFSILAERAAAAGALHQLTLVPDAPDQSTSDHGWNLAVWGDRLAKVIEELKPLGARVSLFMDPDADAIPAAASVGADRIELYTEPYARAFDAIGHSSILAAYSAAAHAARAAGLGINAGHDLNLDNLPAFVDHITELEEVSIGHALIADALWMGLEPAVKAYLNILHRAARPI